MWYNPIMTFLLRSPLQGLLGDTMLITVTGRRSGRKYTTPVTFYSEGEALWVMSSRDRTWWRNLRGGADVSVWLHGRTVPAFGEAILDEEQVAQQLTAYLRHVPIAARSLGVRLEDGVPDPAAIRRLAKEHLFVKVCPS